MVLHVLIFLYLLFLKGLRVLYYVGEIGHLFLFFSLSGCKSILFPVVSEEILLSFLKH